MSATDFMVINDVCEPQWYCYLKQLKILIIAVLLV